MKKTQIAIVGCGFAGAAALRILAASPHVAITVFDPKAQACFLPLLPDVLSGQVSAHNLEYDIAAFVKQYQSTFVQEAVVRIDTQTKTLYLSAGQSVNYDYVLLTAGSETNFYNNASLEKNALKVDGIADILRIQQAIVQATYTTIVISGGGYTGLETAAHVRRLLQKKGHTDKSVVLIEFADSVLRPMPAWIKKRVAQYIESQQIHCRLNTAIANYQGTTVTLQTGEKIENALLIWTAGVKTPQPAQQLSLPKDAIGRIKTDAYLQAAPGLFVAGDCAQFIYRDKALRMSVRFAVDEGRRAARNILRSIAGQPLKRFCPLDPGFIIPLATAQGCGIVFGVKIVGRLATFLHYFLCVFLSHDVRTRWEIIKNLFIK